jgi:hypothetical protein
MAREAGQELLDTLDEAIDASLPRCRPLLRTYEQLGTGPWR